MKKIKKKRKKKSKNKRQTSFFTPNTKGNFIVVKTSLKSILKDYETNFPIINNLVLECNEIVIRTYQFIRLFILHKYYKNETIPKLDKDTILYFIRACGVRNKCGKTATNKIFEKVGAPIRDDVVKVNLPFFMPSLDKIKPNKDTLTRWIKKYNNNSYHISEKLDGLSGMVTYSKDNKIRCICI